MGDTEAPDRGPRERLRERELRVLCKVDVTGHGLDVDWTNGAIFHFASERRAERWLQAQNATVPGTLHLRTNSPGTEPLDPDYYLYYRPPNSS